MRWDLLLLLRTDTDACVPIHPLAADGESSGEDLLRSLNSQEDRGFIFQLGQEICLFSLNGISDSARIPPQFTF